MAPISEYRFRFHGSIGSDRLLAAQRAVGVPDALRCDEPTTKTVVGKKAVGDARIAAQQDLHGFHSGQASHDSHDSAKDPGLCARCAPMMRLRLFDEASIAGVFVTGNHHHQLSLKPDCRSGNQGNSLNPATIRYEKACAEIVTPVYDDIITSYQFPSNSGVSDSYVMSVHDAKGIQGRNRLSGAVHLHPVHIVGSEEDLPLEIGKLDRVAVDESYTSDTGRGKIQCSGRSNTACADDQHPCRFQAGLP